MPLFLPQQSFPATRPRRLRQAAWSRDLVAESRLSVQDLIWPLFVIEGTNIRQPIDSMPRVFRLSIDQLVPEAKKAAAAGIPLLAIFPVIEPSLKDEVGSLALDENNLVARAVRAVKQQVPQMGVMCDIALDPYTSHGHDGVFNAAKLAIDNDRTVVILADMAVKLAAAGCDVIAPSDMMDGRIGAIRRALEAAGFSDCLILSYAVKYASGFYGPFREAVGSAGNLGKASKSTYQMDPRNSDEALREVALDLAEGADMVMVKPGMPYLDMVRRVKDSFAVPTIAYQVSGEYAMLNAAGNCGWLDYDRVMMESLIGFKRAGADAIVTYAALEVAERLKMSAAK